MSRAMGFSVLILAGLLALAGTPAAAQDGGNLSSIVTWSIQAGSTEEFEAGLVAHNQFHADQGDPVPIMTWMIVSGPAVGSYGRGSFGHSWADFDQDEEFAKADTADSAATITPYIKSSNPTIWAEMPELSNPADGPGNVLRVIQFAVRPGHAGAFEQGVAKIHAALSEHDWPSYLWHSLVDGGRTPTYAVVLPRENYAGFAPGETTFMEALGEDGPAILQAMGAATESQMSFTLQLRTDLSYFPASDE